MASKITVMFVNGDTCYGTEDYYVDVEVGDISAEAIGRELLVNSRYDDDRIPDRHYEFEHELIEADDVPEGAKLHAFEGKNFSL